MSTFETEPMLTPKQVADAFSVDPKTVARWAKAGRITAIRTLGGHRRFREAEVRALLAVPSDATRVLPAGHPDVAAAIGIGDGEWP